MRGPAPPSLGDMLQKAGLLDAAMLDSLLLVLRERLRQGTPTSLGRLLLERGVPATRVLAIAASGDKAAAVRCDACAAIQTVPQPAAREFPCTRCGAYLLPLGPASDGSGGSTIIDDAVIPLPAPMTPTGVTPDPSDDTTMSVGTTLRFEGVLELPSQPAELTERRVPRSEGGTGTTLNFNKVLPIPGDDDFATEAIPPEGPHARVGIPGPRGIPPKIHAAPLPPTGIPPVVNVGTASSSGVRRPPPTPRFGVDTEAPTVADTDGGAFAEAATANAAALASPAPRPPSSETRPAAKPPSAPTAVPARPPSESRPSPVKPERVGSNRLTKPRSRAMVALVFGAVFVLTFLGVGALAFLIVQRMLPK